MTRDEDEDEDEDENTPAAPALLSFHIFLALPTPPTIPS
jgi:hypothetical protein